jgi:hypothetical protein
MSRFPSVGRRHPDGAFGVLKAAGVFRSEKSTDFLFAICGTTPVSETTRSNDGQSDAAPSTNISAPPASKDEHPKTAMEGGIIGLVLVAIITATVSYIFGVLNDRRKAELDFVNAQIERLYGPLYALTQANNEIWKGFKNRYWRNGSKSCYFFTDWNPPTVEETKRWRHWMKNVFQPLNLRMEAAISDHSQFVIGNSMPKAFLDQVAQTEAYKAIIANWNDSVDFDHCGETCAHLKYIYNTAPLDYPDSLIECVKQDYNKLKMKQETLQKSFFNLEGLSLTPAKACNQQPHRRLPKAHCSGSPLDR